MTTDDPTQAATPSHAEPKADPTVLAPDASEAELGVDDEDEDLLEETTDEEDEAAKPNPLAKWFPKPVPSKNELKFRTVVAGARVTFIVPKTQPALVYELCVAAGANQIAGLGAAIGCFWFGQGKPEAAKQSMTTAIPWGRSVANELLQRGMPIDQLYGLGRFLLDTAAEQLPVVEPETGFLG